MKTTLSKTKEVEVIEVGKEIVPVMKPFIVGIKDAKTMGFATEALSTLNKILDRLVTEEKKITEPIKQGLKEVESRYKPAKTELKDNIQKIRDMMSEYQDKVDAEAERIANKVGEGKGKLKAETAAKKIEEQGLDVTSYNSNAGSVKFRKDEVFEVEDISKIPAQYLLPNEVEIRKAMKAGIKLPGVKYFFKNVPINTR